jgi:hypothetical protein
MEARCPAGQTTNDYRAAGEDQGGHFQFAAATCQSCSSRAMCTWTRAAHDQHPSRRSLAATGPGPQPNRGGTEEFTGTSGSGASTRAVGAIRDSREPILWANQDLPASGNGSRGRERELGGGILQAPGGAGGNPLPKGRLCNKRWTFGRLFCRLGPTLRSPGASLGVADRVRTPSGYAELRLKTGVSGRISRVASESQAFAFPSRQALVF